MRILPLRVSALPLSFVFIFINLCFHLDVIKERMWYCVHTDSMCALYLDNYPSDNKITYTCFVIQSCLYICYSFS